MADEKIPRGKTVWDVPATEKTFEIGREMWRKAYLDELMVEIKAARVEVARVLEMYNDVQARIREIEGRRLWPRLKRLFGRER
jgi:hypothetical protein